MIGGRWSGQVEEVEWMTGGRWNDWKVEEVETEVEQDKWKGSNHVEESRGQSGDEVEDGRRENATKWRSSGVERCKGGGGTEYRRRRRTK